MLKKSKHIFLTILNVIISFTIGYGQNIRKIEISDLMITNISKHSFVNLFDTKHKIIKSFGQPKRIKKGYFVKFDFKGEMIEYNGADFYFIEGKLEAFELKNNSFYLKVKGRDDYAAIGQALKGFSPLRANEKSTNVTLQKNGFDWDEVLGFEVGKSHKITYIACGPD